MSVGIAVQPAVCSIYLTMIHTSQPIIRQICYRIPLAVSQPQPSIIATHLSHRPRANMGHVQQETRGQAPRPDNGHRLGLGARAVTELDFSR